MGTVGNGRVLSCLVFVWAFPAFVVATDYPPADHAGTNLVMTNGDRIWGVHTGINEFRVPESARVRVEDFDGTDTICGSVEIHATRIVIEGWLDASGAGYTGGSGGGGGGGCYANILAGGGGFAGDPAYGDSPFRGQPGESAKVLVLPGKIIITPGAGGPGGVGDGPFAGGTAEAGGYAAPAANGDSSLDLSTLMGSGGGGNPGAGGSGGAGGTGGNAGGCGGGMIRLFPSSEFVMKSTSQVLASGCEGRLGFPGGAVLSGGDGGDSLRDVDIGNAPGTGGAGGGILVDMSTCQTVSLEPRSANPDAGAALIVSLGGGRIAANGGTVKVRVGTNPPAIPEGTIQAGRSVVLVPTAARDWDLYE
jgi:hypothetical protein